MAGREARRQSMVKKLADHILAVGLPGASLRPLASAVGTSDRMLLYYFAGKQELLTATLGLLAERLMTRLDRALPGEQPYAALLPRLWDLLRQSSIQPYMYIWLELAALSARREEPFRTIAAQLASGFLQWTAGRLRVKREEDRISTAALLLVTVEGMVLLQAMGQDATVSAALGHSAPRSSSPPQTTLRQRPKTGSDASTAVSTGSKRKSPDPR